MTRVPRAEIVSVGTELLLGQTVDTNAAEIGRALAEVGIPVYLRTTVGDNADRLAAALRESLDRVDLVVTTGGLGPTEDDLTVETAAAVLARPLERDETVAADIETFFRRRGRVPTPNNFKQALVPRDARVIRNRWGTAPGLIVEDRTRVLVMLPGVPHEMRGMLHEAMIPYLRERGWAGASVIRSRVLRTTGSGESAVETMVRDLLHGTNPTVAPLAHPGEVQLRITASGSEEEVARLLGEAEAALRGRLGSLAFGTDDERLEAVVGRMLGERGLTLSVAESCTGGLVADRITNVPGSSAYFLSGVVAYADAAKHRMLGVAEDVLAAHGAVSAAVASAMAQGVRQLARSDLGVADTGIAGPSGATPAKPVGLVYVAVADAGGFVVREHRFGSEPGREGIKRLASQAALNLVRLRLLGEADA